MLMLHEKVQALIHENNYNICNSYCYIALYSVLTGTNMEAGKVFQMFTADTCQLRKNRSNDLKFPGMAKR